MTIAVETRQRALLKIGFRESFTEDSLAAGYERRTREPAGLDLMPLELADQLRAAWEEHGANLYVVRSAGIPIGWAAVHEVEDSRLVVPRFRYGRQLTERHQALVRKA